MATFTPDDGSAALDPATEVDFTVRGELFEPAGDLEVATVDFGFAGLDGSWVKSLGARSNPYLWTIQVEAAGATPKQTIRDFLLAAEKLQGAKTTGVMTDTLGKALAGCTVEGARQKIMPEPIGGSVYRCDIEIAVAHRRPLE